MKLNQTLVADGVSRTERLPDPCVVKPRILARTVIAVLFSCVILYPPAFSQVPGIINYQGRIVDNGTNFTGTGQFEFALVNGTSGTTNYWANDGTAAGEPGLAVPLPVTNGLYSVLLGDTTVSNMTVAIPATVFHQYDVRLRVWFNDGVSGFQQLSPDQRLAAIGYALMAASVPAGAIGSAQLASNAVTAAPCRRGGHGRQPRARGGHGSGDCQRSSREQPVGQQRHQCCEPSCPARGGGGADNEFACQSVDGKLFNIFQQHDICCHLSFWQRVACVESGWGNFFRRSGLVCCP
jgi:hypothetical protein